MHSYYASIDHYLLYDRLCTYVTDKRLRRLLWQYLQRTIEWGGTFQDIERGISAGCALSPLIASFYLYECDAHFEKKDLFYIRYMDDILIMTKSRWHLKRAIKQLKEIFTKLRLFCHPDKTTIGRIRKGFDFLGYAFKGKFLSPSHRHYTSFHEKLTREKLTREKLSRLLEQRRKGARKGKQPPSLETYLNRWPMHWAGLGVWRFEGFAIEARFARTSAYPAF